MSNENIVLTMTGITKTFPGVKALDDVRLELRKGEVHVLLGENGAGKSTLMKVLSGIYPADSGEIRMNGETVHITSPHSAQLHGISMIHQELMLADNVEVYKNVFIGRELMKNRLFGIIDAKKMREECDAILNGEIKANIDVTTLTGKLSVAQKQLVEIAKAVSWGAKIIIMDEPTSSLTEKDINVLFDLIWELKKNGATIVYISHKMDEITRIADRVSILRDGRYIETVDAKTTTIDHMISSMVGRDLGEKYPKVDATPGETALQVCDLCCEGVLENVNLEARCGEVVGLFGLIGSGRTELAKAIFGALPITSGEIKVFGETVSFSSPDEAISKGIGLIPEDRKLEGFVGAMSIKNNIALPIIKKLKKGLFVNRAQTLATAEDYKEKMAIKTPSVERAVLNLSGGNQQKVVIAKWLASNSRILIFDEPTRGIDIGAKIEIYKKINELKNKNISIIMISSEMPELLGISDRVFVMRNGRLSEGLDNDNLSQEEVLKWAL